MLKLKTLGGLAIFHDGRPIDVSGIRKPLAILAYVAAAPDMGVSRDRLQALFWPESSGERARAALKQALYLIRRSFGTDPLTSHGLHLCVDSSVFETDLSNFQRSLKSEEFDAAIDSYGGPFLDGVYLKDLSDFEQWVESERARLADLYAGALEKFARKSDAQGNTAAAADSWQRRAELDPLNGRVALEYMRALVSSGARAQALRFGQVHTALVLQELGVPADPGIAAYREELERTTHAAHTASVERAHPSAASQEEVSREVGDLHSGADRTAHRGRPRQAIAWSTAALAALAALWLTTPWFEHGRSLISRGKVNSGDALLVADFRGTGSDSAVGSALAEAMRQSLRESRVVTLTSAPAIGAALERMRRSRSSKLDAATAVEIAQRIGVKAVVTGSVTPLRRGYLVTAALIAASSGDELVSFQGFAGAPDSLTAAVDQLARRLRGKIGESLKSIATDPPLAQVTTASLEALKKFTEANHANGVEGDYPKAVRLLKEAVALDPTFGSAYRNLAVTTLNSGVHREQAPEFEEKAYELRDRMTERERLITIASYYGNGGPHPDARKSVEAWSVVVDRFPEASLFLNQAIAYRMVRDFVREDSAYRHAIAAPGGAGAFPYFNLVRAELNLGHISGAREALRVAAARFPGDPRIEQENANIAYAEGNADSARAACQRSLAAKLTQARAIANGCLANLALREGRVAQARRYRKAADALGDSLGQPADSVGDQLLAAELNARVYRRPDANLQILNGVASALANAEMAPRGRRPHAIRSTTYALYIPPPLLRAASLFAMAGRADRTAALLEQYDRETDDTVSRRLEDAAHHEVLGWIHMSHRQPLAAVAEFRRADTVSGAPASSCRICIDLNLAEAFQRANLTDSAIAALEHYVNTTDAYRLQHDAMDLGPTLRRLAELYAAKGDRARAVAYYSRFVELWKHADPDLQPQMIEAHRFVATSSRMGPALAPSVGGLGNAGHRSR